MLINLILFLKILKLLIFIDGLIKELMYILIIFYVGLKHITTKLWELLIIVDIPKMI